MDPVARSKLVALVLRHRPSEVGVSLDAGGWTSVAALAAGLSARDPSCTAEDVRDVVASSNARFELDPSGTRVRARHGHSIPVDLGLVASPPPLRLFHGTVARALPAILEQGLVPGQRQHVHLSETELTARRVGARRGSPIVLVVDAAALAATGQPLYRSASGVWLTASVPPAFLSQA